ncbi:DUF4465 domain-containing protein [Thermophagus sp. OGC60D27]|uniref:DUF4465 domain-containing protein n=1 Tax=Thermophagus sp. OGC60D27 TaxID=3458415 RepID=UPI004037CC75
MEVNLGDTIILAPKITYNYDALYEWRKNGILLEESGQILTDTATNLGSIEYFFKVTTPYGIDSMYIPVDVIILANFDELAFSVETDTFNVGAFPDNGFTHKGLFFPNTYTNDTIWTGFGLSNIGVKSSDYEDITPHSVYNNQDQSDYFLLVRLPNGLESSPSIISFNDGKDHLLKSVEINNTTLGRYLMKFGTDHYERMGGSGSNLADWCKITITGITTNGQTTSSIEFFLADYRFENNKRDYIVEEWTTIDLSTLGEVNKIQISISSSKTDENGNGITPEMFCIDNLKVFT